MTVDQKKEFVEAWVAARRVVLDTGEQSTACSRRLATLLGFTYLNADDWAKLPYELLPTLQKLAGPYAHAILKAYRIQRGLE